MCGLRGLPRWTGSGESVALVTREQMMKLKESVYAVVLGAAEDNIEAAN